MSLYSAKSFVAIGNSYDRKIPARAEDIFIVDACENIPGRMYPILFCTNIVSGEKREVSSDVIDNVSPNLAKKLLEQNIKDYSSALVNMQENLNLFQEID
jgi:hypothetical protein